MDPTTRVWRSWRKAGLRLLMAVGLAVVWAARATWLLGDASPSARYLWIGTAGFVVGLLWAITYYLATSLTADETGIIVRRLFYAPRRIAWGEIDHFDVSIPNLHPNSEEAWTWNVACMAVLTTGGEVRLPMLDRSRIYYSKARAERKGPPEIPAMYELIRRLERWKGPTGRRATSPLIVEDPLPAPDDGVPFAPGPHTA